MAQIMDKGNRIMNSRMKLDLKETTRSIAQNLVDLGVAIGKEDIHAVFTAKRALQRNTDWLETLLGREEAA